MADNQIESHEERVRILREKAAREGASVPPEVFDYIADKYGIVQTLKGALVQVMVESRRKSLPIDMALARRALGDAPLPPEAAAAPVAPDGVSRSEDSAGGVDAEGVRAPAEDPERRDAPSDAPAAEPHAPIPEPDYPVDLFAYGETEPLTEPAAPDAEAVPAFVEPVADSVPAPAPQALAPAPQAPAPAPQAPAPAPFVPAPSFPPARVYFAAMRSPGKKSLVERAGTLLQRAGLGSAIAEDDLVAIKLHFGEEGNTGFIQPIFLREVVARVKAAGGRPFLTDANTLYRGQRANAVDHLACAIHNGFSYATVEAPIIIADGLDGRDAVDVPVRGRHFDSVRLGAAAVHADAMVVVTHVKGHEATGFGGALKNVGMGLGCRSAKQRMHADFRPEVTADKCTACGRCVKWCPVGAIAIGPDRVARIDYETCYGCGECVAACAFGAIATQWKTEPEAIQEKIVEHVAGALAGKEGKVVYLSFITNVSPDCDCWNFSDAGVVADIGVLASTDIVAIEQAAYDLVTAAAGLPGTRGEGLVAGTDKFTAITGIDGTRAIEYAQEMGLGTRAYDLVEVG